MMRVRFVHLKKHIDIGANMKVPKKIEQLRAWFNEARKAIPEIPDGYLPSPWQIRQTNATPHLVVFELDNRLEQHDKNYDYCHVVIYRRPQETRHGTK
jgi:hypothetical protein